MFLFLSTGVKKHEHWGPTSSSGILCMRISSSASFRAVVRDVGWEMELRIGIVIGSCLCVAHVKRPRRATPPDVFEVGVVQGERVAVGIDWVPLLATLGPLLALLR